jgi:quinol monooxygenase YgiN
MTSHDTSSHRVAAGDTLAPAFAASGLAQASHAAAAEQLSFVVYLPVKPAERERLRSMMFEVLDAMSRETDFVGTWVHEDMDDPHTIVNYETWACSREDFLRRHLAKPYRQALEKALPDLLSGARRLVFLRPLRAYPRRGT